MAPTETTDTPGTTDLTTALPVQPGGGRGIGPLLVRALRGNVRQYGMLVALALIVVVFQIWTDGILLQPSTSPT